MEATEPGCPGWVTEAGYPCLGMAAGCLRLEMAVGFASEWMGPCFELPWPWLLGKTAPEMAPAGPDPPRSRRSPRMESETKADQAGR